MPTDQLVRVWECVTLVWLSMNIRCEDAVVFSVKNVRIQVCGLEDVDDLGTWCVHRLVMDIEHVIRVGCVFL